MHTAYYSDSQKEVSQWLLTDKLNCLSPQKIEDHNFQLNKI